MTQKPPKNSKFAESLAVAVASGSTIAAAAGALGCSDGTAYAISATDEFRQRVKALRTEASAMAVARLSSAASQAADTLVGLLSSEDEKIQLAAATKLLTMLGPLSETHEFRERLDALEDAAAKNSLPRIAQ